MNDLELKESKEPLAKQISTETHATKVKQTQGCLVALRVL